ncbi:DUF4279 domain-containing protein [Lysinibacillus sp. 3P01SB]|uniref:DUF4279 domain-containing protein n=1 Tax=Lysinibacillus sp. 3P01SB TaxID=3132284 RepID=UPI0039A633FB
MEKTNLYAYIKFSGNDDFPLEVVTNRLQIQPTETRKLGERSTPNHPINKKVNFYTSWTYKIKKETLSSDDVLSPLLEVFQEKTHIINELKAELNLDVQLELVVNIHGGYTPGLFIHPEFSQFAAAINAGLDIDTYVYPFYEPEEE